VVRNLVDSLTSVCMVPPRAVCRFQIAAPCDSAAQLLD
jgi:hypothetical protein